MADAVLRALAADDELATKLADVIMQLTREAIELGELESYQYLGPSGQLVTGKKFPSRWLDRLGRGIETGAIDHLSIKRITEIMLQGPR